jgi:hypothetical protein
VVVELVVIEKGGRGEYRRLLARIAENCTELLCFGR